MSVKWPDELTSYIDGFPRGHKLREKRDRMMKSAEPTGKAWHDLSKVAKDPSTLPHIFLLFPDHPTPQPYTALYGERVRTPEQEKRHYSEVVKAINVVINILNADNYRQLMQDIPHGETADPEVWEAIRVFNETSTKVGLLSLRKIINGTKPDQKRLSKDKNESQAARATYTIQVADLNRYLTTPKHTALATLARANCPNFDISPYAVKKAWRTSCPTG